MSPHEKLIVGSLACLAAFLLGMLVAYCSFGGKP